MRLFIATSIQEQRDLNARIAALKPRLPAASWVRSEGQHLTLAFLGEQEESLIERLATPLQQRLQHLPRFDATLHGCGFFPNPRRPRVGWIGLDPEAPFLNLAEAVRDEVRKAGVQLDGADFKPHLTLMRIRNGWPPASIRLLEESLSGYRSAPFAVDAVTLYSSVLASSGAIHTPLRRFALA